jgi:hypothetical protein
MYGTVRCFGNVGDHFETREFEGKQQVPPLLMPLPWREGHAPVGMTISNEGKQLSEDEFEG